MSISNWETDPTGRHQYRWYDGERWTDQVADNGIQAMDPVSIAEARLPFKAPEPDYSLPAPPTPAQPASEYSAPEPSSLVSSPSVPPPANSRPDVAFSQTNDQHIQVSATLASRRRRIWGFFLELMLMVITVVIGWLIWSLVIYSQGKSPAKKVLKMRVYRLGKGERGDTVAGWGWMALRELLLRGVGLFILFFQSVPFLTSLAIIWLIVNSIFMINSDRKQALWDKLVRTVVVDER